MPPNKRRTKRSDVDHRGRVTVSRDPTEVPLAAAPSLSQRATHTESGPAKPAASSRYTPPVKSFRFRPGWHKTVGALFVVLGLAVVILNDAMLGNSVTLLPGGHSELYLVLGVMIAGYGTRWFGWFDREK
jgi:hypothetical protein